MSVRQAANPFLWSSATEWRRIQFTRLRPRLVTVMEGLWAERDWKQADPVEALSVLKGKKGRRKRARKK